MTDVWRRKLTLHFEEMAGRPLRCLAVAVKESGLGVLATVSGQGMENMPRRVSRLLEDTKKFVHLESGMILVGLVGIKDPARPEVAESIALCRKCGARTTTENPHYFPAL